MELMIKLEEGITALTNELNGLREENARLRAEVADAQIVIEQNYSLEAALQKEQEARIFANEQLEKLLNMVREQLSEKDEA